jgi:K+-transporting ATPase KdpF subunit
LPESLAFRAQGFIPTFARQTANRGEWPDPHAVLLRPTFRPAMETIIVSIIALLLFIYLFVAMIRPEKF